MRKDSSGVITRRQTLAGLSLLAAGGWRPAAPALAQQAWPRGRTIRMVVPFPPGGATDVIARLVSDRLARMWETSLVVENRAGAGANIGMEMVARAEPNGETILMGTIGIAINKFLYKSLKFDPSTSFEPVSLITIMPNMAVSPAAAPFASVAELIDYGRKNPGKLTYGTSGLGTSVHLSGELFKRMAGIEMQHLHYRGSAPALQDLVAGRTDVMFDNIASCLPHVQAKTLKGLAVTTAKRSKFVPDLPTVADTLPGFDVSPWFGVLAPLKTPPEIVERISRDIKSALADPSVSGKLDALAAETIGSTPQEFAALIARETEKWGKLINEAKISAE